MVKINILFLIFLLNFKNAYADEVELAYFDKKVKFKLVPDREFKFKVQQKPHQQARTIRGRTTSRFEFVPIGHIARSSQTARTTAEINAPILIANGEMEYVPNGKLIVKFKRQLSEVELNNWIKKYSVEFDDILELKDDLRYIFVFQPGIEVLQLANAISQDDMVKEVAPDMMKSIKPRKIPSESELNYRKTLLKIESGNQR